MAPGRIKDEPCACARAMGTCVRTKRPRGQVSVC